MNIRAYFSLLVLLISTFIASLNSASLMLGTIRFPQSIAVVPTLRIYCGGRIIPCEIDQKNKLITFSIPKYSQQFHFNLLITEKVSFAQVASKYQSTTNNTAAYLKLDEGQPYKFYSLLLVPELVGETTQLRYSWNIKNESIDPENLKVPDDSIIICCKPGWISTIRGSNNFELPTIEVTPNIVTLSGSEQLLREKSAQIMLASLDSDTMHSLQDKQPIKQQENRIIIAAPAA